MAGSPEVQASSAEQQEAITAEPMRYRIDSTLYQAQGRSFTFFLRQRMCAESLARLGEETETQVAVEAPKSRRVKFERRTARYGDDPIAVVQECCSKTPSYRDPQLPLKEVLYRLLLAEGNRPKTVQELNDEVVAWVGYGDGRVITPEVIQRLLEHDDFYGFAPTSREGG